MTDRKFYPLLIFWVLLAICPAVFTTYGVIGAPITLNAAVTGTSAITWIAGWLLQFAAFFWLMAIARKQNFLWWFVASGVPWAIDWTMGVSPVFAVLWPAVVIATAVWIALAERSYESLEEHGIRASGTVLQVYNPMMNVVVNNVYIKRKLRVRIQRSDGTAPYEADYNGLFMLGEIPSPGDQIPLLVDPANPNHFAYDDKASDG